MVYTSSSPARVWFTKQKNNMVIQSISSDWIAPIFMDTTAAQYIYLTRIRYTILADGDSGKQTVT